MAGTTPIYNPATGEQIASVEVVLGKRLEAAVDASEAAAREWRALGPVERGRLVAEFGRTVRKHANELAQLDATNAGNPVQGMLRGALQGARTLEYFAGLSLQLGGDTIPASTDHLHYTLREPFGVVVVITPYNHPTLFATARTAAPLVAGNTVILKPAHQTPLTALRIQEIADAILPPNVFTVVTGDRETGSALVRHPSIRRIGFTGGRPTALAIASDAAASGHIKRITYELGGKNAIIILPDVDVDNAAAAVVEGMNLRRVAGQSCGSTSRLFVHESIHRRVVDAVVDRLQSLKMGLPADDSTDMGPLITESHRQRVERYVAKGKAEGAQLILGGRRPTDPPIDRGFFFPPTVFDFVEPWMEIAMEEIFGPVLAVLSWESEEEMIRAVNATDYGLTASIYTNDLNAALRLAGRVEAGYIWVNNVERRWIGVPFGGQKDSGTGTEYSLEELFSYTQNKSVNIAL